MELVKEFNFPIFSFPEVRICWFQQKDFFLGSSQRTEKKTIFKLSKSYLHVNLMVKTG